MKKIIVFILLNLLISNFLFSQNKNFREIYVTEVMCDKISLACSNKNRYALTIFYKSNKNSINYKDAEKVYEILNKLYLHQNYAKNFIIKIYEIWGYKGLKNIGFNEKEIDISKKIILQHK